MLSRNPLQETLFPAMFPTPVQSIGIKNSKIKSDQKGTEKSFTKEEDLFTSKILKLSDNQVTALKSFVTFVSNTTAETIVGNIDKLKRIKTLKIRDMLRETGDWQGGMCIVAKRNNQQDGHKLRYLHVVEIYTSQDKCETLEFGVDCLSHVLELTPAERVLIRGLNAWVTNSTYRWLLRQLGHAIANGISADQIVSDWRESVEYREYLKLVLLLDSNINLAYPSNLKNIATDAAERTRLQSIGRATSALKSATLLENNNLPIPPQLLGRIRRAAYQIKQNLKFG